MSFQLSVWEFFREPQLSSPFDKIEAMALPPKAHASPNIQECERILDRITSYTRNYFSERNEYISSTEKIVAHILTPFGSINKTKCVIYYPPSGCTTSEMLHDWGPHLAPYQIFEKERCSLVLFDYRRTGLSRTPEHLEPTSTSMIEDGEVIIDQLMKIYKKVIVFGSSYGGSIAAASLKEYLVKNRQNANRTTLISHDSFDNHSSLEHLVKLPLKIFILCHENDPVITEEKRLANQLKDHNKITIIRSPLFGHANLSEDMVKELWKE